MNEDTDAVERRASLAARWSRFPVGLRSDLVWAALVHLALASIFLLLRLAPSVSVPVLVALALAFVFDPVVDRLEARGLSRTTGVLLLFGAGVLLLASLLALIVPSLVAQAIALPAYLQGVSAKLVPLLESLLGEELPHDLRALAQEASGLLGQVTSKVGPSLGAFASRALGGTAAAFSVLVAIGLIPLFLFFFLRDFDRLKVSAASLLPARYRETARVRFSELDRLLGAFVQGQLTVAALLAVIYATGLTLSGVKLGLAIGVLAGFFSLVPFVGVGVGIALAAIAIAVDWSPDSLWVAGGAAITFVVGQVLEGSVITPRVVGEKVGLSPVAVMIAILGFGEAFGFVGVLLAVPSAAVVQIVVRVLLEHYRASAYYARGP